MGALVTFTSVSATLENLIVIIVLFKNKDLSTPSYKILRSLAIADFLTGFLVGP